MEGLSESKSTLNRKFNTCITFIQKYTHLEGNRDNFEALVNALISTGYNFMHFLPHDKEH